MKSKLSLSDYPPFQYNYDYRNTSLHWHGSDSRQRFEDNLNDPVRAKTLKEQGWIDADILYTYNSQGFRCGEFDDRSSALALGCSFTEGTGLYEYQAWPNVLSQMLNMHIWNLGTGGGSIDTVFRILDHYIRRLNVHTVFVFMPPEGRFEYQDIDGGFPIIQTFTHGLHESFAKEWLTQTNNGIYNTRKTMLAIKQLCHNFDVPLFAFPSSTSIHYEDQIKNAYIEFDMARDLMHRGPIYQKWIAETMCRLYTDKEEYQDE